VKANVIIETLVTKVKTVLQNHADQLDQPLTVENTESVVKILSAALALGGVEGLKTYLAESETHENTVVHDNQKYQFNRTSNKEFQTPFGKMTLPRRLYQNENGESFVPLDHAWNMENHFATIEVRESVLFALALMPASEARQLFQKCSLYNVAESSFKKIAENLGPNLEKYLDPFLETIRREEAIPVAETKVVAVSMDGVNVLLQESGKKKGRKRQRPGARKLETEGNFDSPTSYRNAVVGSITLYGNVPEGEKSPIRLQSRYVARMPEEKCPTLKRQLENEMKETLDRLPNDVTKVFLSDAAQGIRKEIDTNSAFNDFEKIVDYWHATDHLSNAAEAIFGKGEAEGESWYEAKKSMLLEDSDGAEKVYRSLLYYRDNYKYAKDRSESLKRETTFFCNNKDRMEYKRFRENGWPIGSGVIEAACKSVVKCRFCRSGMRWTRVGGQAILTLRTFIKSDRWDAFWNIYKTSRFTKIDKIPA